MDAPITVPSSINLRGFENKPVRKTVIKSVINPAVVYTDAEWEQLDSDVQSELETRYVLNNPVLMKKIALAEENYRQGKYFIPTDEQLGF
jgi:hypothetical protein